jgi:V8-like Glu-specific endopeptidase
VADLVLTTEERNKLVTEIVANLSDFTDYGIRGRREFVVAAGLGKFLPGIVWGDADRTVAGSLVDKLRRHGFLPERPQYHALGALLSYLLTHPDVNAESKEFMAGLVVRWGLIRDPNRLQELGKDYHLAYEPPPEAAPPTVPVRADLAEQVRQPTFAPVVHDLSALERARTTEDNFLDIYQLLGAVHSAEAVGKVELSSEEPLGTGWLIGPDLLLTNHHVLPTEDHVAEAKVRFGFRKDSLGVAVEGQMVDLDPDCYYTSPAEELDYALVRLTEQPLAHMKVDAEDRTLSLIELIRLGKHRGYLLCAPRRILNLQRVNIIQHPGNVPQKVILTQNYVTADMRSTRVHYQASTKKGSSGSPVFNLQWEVVALHHSSEPVPPIPGVENVNEGIPMAAILKDFESTRTTQGRPLISLLPSVK